MQFGFASYTNQFQAREQATSVSQPWLQSHKGEMATYFISVMTHIMLFSIRELCRIIWRWNGIFSYSWHNISKPKLKQLATKLASFHCGHSRQLRMRRCLTILQTGLHSLLCSGFYSVSQFGSITNGRVHSVAGKHTQYSKITKRLLVNIASTVRKKWWVHLPSANSMCVRDMDRHRGGAEHCSSNAILPGHNRVVPVKRPRHVSNQWWTELCDQAGPGSGGAVQSQAHTVGELRCP